MKKRCRSSKMFWFSLCVVIALLGLTLLPGTPPASAQVISNPLGSLKTVPTPEPKNLNQFLRTDRDGKVGLVARKTAIALGKALFWDQAVGSDGQACASCHFNAGADSRTFGQIDPGLLGSESPLSFESPFSANYQLKVEDFPFSRIEGIDDVVSSQGVFDKKFVSIASTACPDDAGPIGKICDRGKFDPNGFSHIFYPGRNVEPRNTPTQINAVFNFRNFWDGRARNEFNGVNPIGDLDPYARVWLNEGGLKQISLTGKYRLENASLASQSVGPPLSEMEMSYRGRTFPLLGRKLLRLPRALPSQIVHPQDSVLGLLSRYPLKNLRKDFRGLLVGYDELIKVAFQDKWWKGGDVGTGFTQMESNFSLFYGIASMMYMATLRADDSPFDQAFDSGDTMSYSDPGWGDQEKLGLEVFNGKGKCVVCHGGPETTNASVRYVTNEKLTRMFMGNNEPAVYDEGFYNTAVRRCNENTCDDKGLGATIGPLNLPLSMSKFYQLVVANDPSVAIVCENTPEACNVPPVHTIPPETLDPDERVAVLGAFKTPGLRNIDLQAPYFHNGGDLTLKHVVELYDRGGNFPDFNIDNLDPDIVSLGLTDQEENALVALMKAMTDERVRLQKAPFDHPQLFVPNYGELFAVGRDGSAALETFFEELTE